MNASGSSGGGGGGGSVVSTMTSTTPAAAITTTTTTSLSRRRRESSEEFCTAGSLGSIGGSEVGSSVHSAMNDEQGDNTTTSRNGEDYASRTMVVESMPSAASIPAPSASESIPTTAITIQNTGDTNAVTASNGGESSNTSTTPSATARPLLVSTPEKLPLASAALGGSSSTPFEAQTTPQVKNTTTDGMNHSGPPPTITTTINTAIRKSSLKSESSLVSLTNPTIPGQQSKQLYPPPSQRPPKKRKGSVDFTLDHEHSTTTNTAISVAVPTTTVNEISGHSSSDTSLLPLNSSLSNPPPPHPSGSLGSDGPAKGRSGSDSLSSTHGFSLGRLLRADTIDSSLGLPTSSQYPLSTNPSSRRRADTLERLDVLEDEARLAAARIRTSSATTTSSNSQFNLHATGGGSGGSAHRLKTAWSMSSTTATRKKSFGSLSSNSSRPGSTMMNSASSHRLLLEAFMAGDDLGDNDNDHDDDDDDEVDDDENDEEAMELDEDAESLVDSHAAEQAETQELTREQRRERLGSFDLAGTIAASTTRGRLGSFDHQMRDRLGSFDHHVRDRLGSFDVRDRLESFDIAGLPPHHPYGSSRRRDRLESWGGMSDLSIPVQDSTGTDSLIGLGSAAGGSAGGITNSTAALAAAVYTSLANDLSAAANLDGNESISDFLVHDDHEKIPSRISMSRSRLNSINSTATDPSLSHLPTEHEIPSDIQNLVKQAMASVGDQLAEMAEAATEAARDLEDHSELSSAASPLIGAVLDASAKAMGSFAALHQPNRPRSSSLTQGMDIAVDYAAVAAAVNAAEAASGAIDLAVFAHSASTSVASNTSSAQKTASGAKRKRPKLPLKKIKKSVSTTPAAIVVTKTTPKRPPVQIELPPIPKSKMNERDLEMIRERARAAAGYVPPTSLPSVPPPKKRAKIDPHTPSTKVAAGTATPRTIPSVKSAASTPFTPASSCVNTPGSAKSAASKGQSSQKWDSMFDCLLEFVEDRRKEETVDMSEEEKAAWIWDGNVPTTFKAKDGKALGRWINNQRSAKSKGVLKDDREKRLIDAGLKWSVLASNSWNEMLDELRVYVSEQTKAGRKWDGNVPTNYRITTKPGVALRDDEDKNLGRWVNRQRSLYQSGKLRKDRQLSLEKVGLKWSMLATTSWDSMFETLEEYVREKGGDGSEWDGNVPANYRTEDNPPRALGRWINRQRSAYGKDKLKKEYVDKLNKIGLKWSVHERRPGTYPDTPSSAPIGASTNGTDTEAVPNEVPSAPVTNGEPTTPTTTTSAIKTDPQEDDNDKKSSTVTTCTSSSSNSSISRGSPREESKDDDEAPITEITS